MAINFKYLQEKPKILGCGHWAIWSGFGFATTLANPVIGKPTEWIFFENISWIWALTDCIPKK